jgi:hypothetical protein
MEHHILRKIKTWLQSDFNSDIVPIMLSPLEKEQYELIQRVLELEKQLVPKDRLIPFSWEPR